MQRGKGEAAALQRIDPPDLALADSDGPDRHGHLLQRPVQEPGKRASPLEATQPRQLSGKQGEEQASKSEAAAAAVDMADHPAFSQEVVAMKEKERGMSSAMKMYLQRKREHDLFISKERAEFEVGKQHLATMMGLDAANLDQQDIDRSIEYLFPSGLAPEARPSMRPPEEVFPRQKDAEFDVEGRPFHPFFYTLKPHFQESVYRMREHLEAVTIFGDRLRRQGKGPDPEQVLNAGKMAGSRWATQEEVAQRCLEKVTAQEHADFVALLERLVSLPFSYR